MNLIFLISFILWKKKLFSFLNLLIFFSTLLYDTIALFLFDEKVCRSISTYINRTAISGVMTVNYKSTDTVIIWIRDLEKAKMTKKNIFIQGLMNSSEKKFSLGYIFRTIENFSFAIYIKLRGFFIYWKKKWFKGCLFKKYCANYANNYSI